MTKVVAIGAGVLGEYDCISKKRNVKKQIIPDIPKYHFSIFVNKSCFFYFSLCTYFCIF